MSRMRLLADCGNSTVKFALAQEGGIWLYVRLDVDPAAWDAFIRPHAAAIGELVMLSGSRAVAEPVARWWLAQPERRPLRVLDDGPVASAICAMVPDAGRIPVPQVGQYAGCGSDRVLAGLIACAQEQHSLVVVDAGTATTITAWVRLSTGEGAQPPIRFAGGLILPSAQGCIVGLVHQAPALPLTVPLGPGAHAAQRETVGAIGAALGIGYGPMVAACLLKLQRETGIHDCLATGGNCGLLIESAVISRLAYRPSLVIEGLELVCRAADAAGPAPPCG